jgi:hypothetical protein
MKRFTELSGVPTATFLLRWRGRQEGSFSAEALETKLAANEIGLLHEVFYDGRWLTIRDYISEREGVLRAEQQAKEDRERIAREEAEKEAKRREEQRKMEALAEERRRAIQIESAPHAAISAPPALTAQKGGGSGIRTFGGWLLIAGLAVSAYFFLAFDTSVESGVGRVHNIGLMADRQNGIIIGIGLSVVGTILISVGGRRRF